MLQAYEAVFTFWFQEIKPEQWWAVSSDFDEQVRTRFDTLFKHAIAGELFEWRASVHGRLAEIIVLDQFSRNMFRNTPGAFAQDPMALVLAQEAVASGLLSNLSEIERAFLLMPYMHSESKLIHIQAEQLFKAHTPTDTYEFELKHKVIIDRFGRYPHRNDILGRSSTPEEHAFLLEPNSSF